MKISVARAGNFGVSSFDPKLRQISIWPVSWCPLAIPDPAISKWLISIIVMVITIKLPLNHH